MRKTIIALLIYLLIFTVLFFIAWYNYLINVPVIRLGIGADKSNLLVMVLSFMGILKTTVHIFLLGKNHRFSLK